MLKQGLLIDTTFYPPQFSLDSIFNVLIRKRASSCYPVPIVTCSWSCYPASCGSLGKIIDYLARKEKLTLSQLHIQSLKNYCPKPLWQSPLLHTYSPIPLLHSLITDFIFFLILSTILDTLLVVVGEGDLFIELSFTF